MRQRIKIMGEMTVSTAGKSMSAMSPVSLLSQTTLPVLRACVRCKSGWSLGGWRLVACEADSLPPSSFLPSVVFYCFTFSIFSCYIQYSFWCLKDSQDKFERCLGRLTFCLLPTPSPRGLVTVRACSLFIWRGPERQKSFSVGTPVGHGGCHHQVCVCRGVLVSLTGRQADKQTTDGKKATAINTGKGIAKQTIYVSPLDEFCM